MSVPQPTQPSRPKSEKTAIFRVFAGLLLPFMYFVGRYRLTGTENVPATGAFVLAPNHYSNIDPIVIGVAMWKLGRMPRYLAKASLFKVPVLGRMLTAAGQVPVERAGRAREGQDPLAAARNIATAGHAVVIYPRGRSPGIRTSGRCAASTVPCARRSTREFRSSPPRVGVPS